MTWYFSWITMSELQINISPSTYIQTSDSFRFKLSRNSTILLESFIIRPDVIHIWAQRKPLASGEVRAVLWMNSDLQFYHHILILIGEFRYWAEVSSRLKVISQNLSLLQILHVFFRGLQSILWQDGERKREDEIKLRRNDKKRRRRESAVPRGIHIHNSRKYRGCTYWQVFSTYLMTLFPQPYSQTACMKLNLKPCCFPFKLNLCELVIKLITTR